MSAKHLCDLSVLFCANPKFGYNFGDFVRHRRDVIYMETGVENEFLVENLFDTFKLESKAIVS